MITYSRGNTRQLMSRESERKLLRNKFYLPDSIIIVRALFKCAPALVEKYSLNIRSELQSLYAMSPRQICREVIVDQHRDEKQTRAQKIECQCDSRKDDQTRRYQKKPVSGYNHNNLNRVG